MRRTILMSFAALAAASCSESGGGGGGAPPPGNSAPVFTSAATATVDENTTMAYRATATDANGDTVTFALSGGADAARFTINAATGDVSFTSPPDFEAPTDANTNNIYEFNVVASDGTASTTLAVSVTVRDVVETFQVRRVVSGLDQPLFVTGAGDGSNRLFIVQKGGIIRIANATSGVVRATPFLNLSSQISTNSERGLLGLAFAPNYSTSGVFYVYLTNTSGDTEVRRYNVSAGDPDIADPNGDVIMTFAQPASNHNGGWMGFGPEGFLYISSGDGGGNTSTTNPAQNTSSLLGKILRINVVGDDFPADANRDYRIPTSNPFAGGGGAPEVFAYGLRNPFRASFDPDTGMLIIGDVGEGSIEEIDIIPQGTSGQNFGWVRFEGTSVFNASASATGAIPPVLEYFHGGGMFEGNSVTGGVVNRGPVAALQGEYIFGDFVSGNIWSIPVTEFVQGDTLEGSDTTFQTLAFDPDVGSIGNISSFGTDDDGNVYIVDFGGEIFRLSAS